MSEQVDGTTLQEASAVLRRLAELVEDGTLTATADEQLITAASWQGAAEALYAAGAPAKELG